MHSSSMSFAPGAAMESFASADDGIPYIVVGQSGFRMGAATREVRRGVER
jgi:hypothetical protein